MIKIEHCVLPSPEQMEFIIEGMRNPKNSWDKSDSDIYAVTATKDGQDFEVSDFALGKADHELMLKLAFAGPEHRKYMRMMTVYVRITAPLYWWKEFDTYKVGTVSNSCSTMHKIQAKHLSLDDFSTDLLTPASMELLQNTIDQINKARIHYNDFHDEIDWWQMIQLLPSSYNQTRNIMLNYEVLCDIYRQRKNHKLAEWQNFCHWIEYLPWSELICQWPVDDVKPHHTVVNIVGQRDIMNHPTNNIDTQIFHTPL
jgi:hypothetical protein